MTLKKIRVIATLFSALISIGCSGEGVFENPDSIRVTTLEAIHGKRGHLINVNISKDIDGVTKQAVLEIWDKEVSDATLYVVIESGNTGIGGMIDLLKNATRVAIVPDLPENTKPWTRLVLTFGDGSGDPFAGYLQITAPTGIEYLSLRGTVTQERRDWFLTEITKPPKVLDTMPATVTEISYYSDSGLTKPLVSEVFVGGTVYTKVTFSKNVPIVFADDGHSRPSISSAVRLGEFQYRMRPRDTDIQSGDAKPYRDTKNIFICRYDVQTDDFDGMFHTYVDRRTAIDHTLRVIFFRHTGETLANTDDTITDWLPHDFVGQVYTLRIHPTDAIRSPSVPVTGVTITIVSGPRSGESTITDRNGRYRFLNVEGDELHLRTEKNHFEPKEVIVHRSRPTSLPDGSIPNHYGDPQKEPGNILIGQVWPDEVRILLKEVLLVHDLLYIEAGTNQENNIENNFFWGYYGSGVVFMFSNEFFGTFADTPNSITLLLKGFEHEIAHVHQHAVVAVDGSGDIQQWIHTPEGKAYAEARKKDLEAGEKMYYDINSYTANSLLENAAEHCANYWSQKRGAEPWYWPSHQHGKKLEELAPNRFKWAEEWLRKK